MISRSCSHLKIAFGYKMGVGKDEACSYLMKKYGGSKISFASPLYDIQSYAQHICGFKEEKDRHFLQFIGTEWARKKDPDVLINLALKKTYIRENSFISDLRFSNEFYTLKKEGWSCVKIIRPDVIEDRAGTGSITHISENNLNSLDDKEWNYSLQNNGNLEDFHKKLDILYFQIWRDKIIKNKHHT